MDNTLTKDMHSEKTPESYIDQYLTSWASVGDEQGDIVFIMREYTNQQTESLRSELQKQKEEFNNVIKELSDTKANLHRAYNGLENHKALKLELEKQKELNAELRDNLKVELNQVRGSWSYKQVIELIDREFESLKNQKR